MTWLCCGMSLILVFSLRNLDGCLGDGDSVCLLLRVLASGGSESLFNSCPWMILFCYTMIRPDDPERSPPVSPGSSSPYRINKKDKHHHHRLGPPARIRVRTSPGTICDQNSKRRRQNKKGRASRYTRQVQLQWQNLSRTKPGRR